jgi:hypothetical protein
MIISSSKSFEEILESLKGENNIFVIGCDVCAAKMHTGGEPEVKDMCARLEKAGKNVIGWVLPTGTCSIHSYESLVEKNTNIKKADAILVMACGSGTSIIAKLVDVPIYPANNTESLGGIYQGNVFHAQCAMCGDCTIADFGGICPTAQCPKGLLNGPCGGSMSGRCEVNSDMDCVWELIYQRLEKLGKLDLLEKVIEPKDNVEDNIV